MELTANTPTMPETGYTTQIPVRDQSGEMFVFYAGDLITPRVKARDLLKRGGGIVVNHENLLYNGGFIPRCEITALRDHFHSESAAFIEPEKQDNGAYVRTYTAIENGVPQTVGMIDNGRGEAVHDKLLRRPVYPRQQIAQITGKGEGIVQMPVTRADVRRVQYFLFPEWDDIRRGDKFPPTVAQLREYFVKRRDVAADAIERGIAYDAVELDCANAAILSCDQFIAFQSEIVTEKIAKFERYKQKGLPYTFGDRADLLFAQLGIQRPDRAAQQSASQLSELTSAVGLLAQIQIKNQVAATEDPRIAALQSEIERLQAEVNAKRPLDGVLNTSNNDLQSIAPLNETTENKTKAKR